MLGAVDQASSEDYADLYLSSAQYYYWAALGAHQKGASLFLIHCALHSAAKAYEAFQSEEFFGYGGRGSLREKLNTLLGRLDELATVNLR